MWVTVNIRIKYTLKPQEYLIQINSRNNRSDGDRTKTWWWWWGRDNNGITPLKRPLKINYSKADGNSSANVELTLPFYLWWPGSELVMLYMTSVETTHSRLFLWSGSTKCDCSQTEATGNWLQPEDAFSWQSNTCRDSSYFLWLADDERRIFWSYTEMT